MLLTTTVKNTISCQSYLFVNRLYHRSSCIGSMKFTDIGSNLGDPIFRGLYHGKQAHPDDFDNVLKRANDAGVIRQVLTADCLKEAEKVLQLAKSHDGLFTTAGCHPCQSKKVKDHPKGIDGYFSDLDKFVASQSGGPRGCGPIVAIGECGLDYDRLFLSEKEDQLAVFPRHIQLANKYDLPCFLHVRTSESHTDFIDIIQRHGPLKRGGVVHSFTGTTQEAQEYIEMGLHIGINGCSLKTEENLKVVKDIPLTHIHLESDCPWCEIRPSHASHTHLPSTDIPIGSPGRPVQVKKERWDPGKMVKGRNEPCSTAQVAYVLASIKGVDVNEVAEMAWKNSTKLFGLEAI